MDIMDPFLWVAAFILIVIGGYVLSGVHKIKPNEWGVYTDRRGIERLLEPGLHFVFPWCAVQRIDREKGMPKRQVLWNERVVVGGIQRTVTFAVSYKVTAPEIAFFLEPTRGLYGDYVFHMFKFVFQAFRRNIKSLDAEAVQTHPEGVATSVTRDCQNDYNRIGLELIDFKYEFPFLPPIAVRTAMSSGGARSVETPPRKITVLRGFSPKSPRRKNTDKSMSPTSEEELDGLR